MIKLAPATNAAARTLRDSGLIGLGMIVTGVVMMELADDRLFRMGSLILLILGVLTILPSLIARGIQLERESRD